jgi:predicted nucleic acid-binding Zn ribbon protein
MNNRVCIVCGARVTNMNPKANTCSSRCTRKRDGKPDLEIIFNHCLVCQSPIEDNATHCNSCGANDFEQ